MKGKLKLEYRHIIILILAAAGAAAVFLLFRGKIILGSQVDWLAQHSVFPEYFRKLFYETGELYPDFAMQIGGGQNIFNFAYYGFLNPWILLSYLFPNIPMNIWISGVSFVSYGLSGVLFYCWLTGRTDGNSTRKVGYANDNERAIRSVEFWVTLLFITAAPLFYHFCTQVMFVNYMPFLCLGLIGTDWYFNKNRKILLCMSVLLMILTSFYFSIGGILCLCLYALYCYLTKAECRSEVLTWYGILGEAFKYLGVIITGVLISGFFLVPTAAALLEGRSSGTENGISDFIALFWPLGEPSRILHDKYGMGLGVLALVAVVSGIFQKKIAEKVLSISLLLVIMIPLVGYALNGFLYNRGKALIPFIPLMCFEMALWISSLKKQSKEEQWKFVVVLIIIALYFCVSPKENFAFLYWLIDLFVVAISVFVYFNWKKDFRVIVIPALCITVISMGVACMDENMGLRWSDFDEEKDQKISEMMDRVVKDDTSLYRMEYYGSSEENFKNINRVFHVKQNITSIYSSTFNSFYHTFRNEIFDLEKPNRNILMEGLNQNVVFRKMMGVKYWISQDMELHKDENIAPIVYGTSKIMDKEIYEALEFPYNQLIFLQYAVVGDNKYEEYETDGGDGKGGNDDKKNIGEDIGKNMLDEDIGEDILNEISIAGKIEGNPQGRIAVTIPESDQERILFVRFHVNNKKNQDVTVDLEGSRNKLSAESHIYYNENTVFSYAVALASGKDEIIFDFSDGTYEISEAEAYLVPLKEDYQLYESEFVEVDAERNIQDDMNETLNKDDPNYKQYQYAQTVLSGTMEMHKNGYLITSIPYDKNFIVLVDGEGVKTEIVNEGFLGIKLSRGEHEILILYQASGKQLGILVTIVGIFITLLSFVPQSSGIPDFLRNPLRGMHHVR